VMLLLIFPFSVKSGLKKQQMYVFKQRCKRTIKGCFLF
jgi:hypothetical protein